MSEEINPLLGGAEPGLSERVDEVLFRFQTWQYRGWVAAFASGLVALLVALGWWFNPASTSVEVETSIPFVADGEDGEAGEIAPVEAGDSASTSEMTTTSAPPVIVHVRGEVSQPGLVELPAGARVADAVANAGGETGKADIHQLNLAAVVVDGMQIIVPAVGDDHVGPLIVHADGVGGSGTGGLVNINTASLAELETLPGVGPAIATAIDQRRIEKGPFASVDDLLDVAGIGPAKLERLADHVTV